MIMTRQGLPTGQMQEETKELLDEYNETYCWEYNDMVDFIKEHGERDFREYYETYNRLCEGYGKEKNVEVDDEGDKLLQLLVDLGWEYQRMGRSGREVFDEIHQLLGTIPEGEVYMEI